MKMSVMRYDGLQGQPFWMQNDQLANSSQYCLKSSARVETDRRKVQRSLHGLNEDTLGSSRNVQMDDSVFNNDIMKVDLKGAKSSKRRKNSPDNITRRKLLRISGLDADSKHLMLASSPSSSDGDESKSNSEEEDERDVHHFMQSRTSMQGEGDEADNNCDINESLAMEQANDGKDYDGENDDEGVDNPEERGGEVARNNGDDLNLGDDSNDFEDEFERDGSPVKNDKMVNSEDESTSLNGKMGKQSGVDLDLNAATVDRRSAVANNNLSRLNQTGVNNVSTTANESRRNKRKNFKPRNIVHHYDMCEDADSETIEDYQLALSNWELVGQQQQQKSLSREPSGLMEENASEEMVQRTGSESPPLIVRPSESGTEDEDAVPGGGGGGDFDQPLDLSDSASLMNNAPLQKSHSRKRNARRFIAPSELKEATSRLSHTVTGSPMDLTMVSRNDDPSTLLCNKKLSNDDISNAMDLSTGHFSSAYAAVSNYATNLTSVPPASSESAATNSDNNHNGADSSEKLSNSRGLSSLPKISPVVSRTGISASLLDLVGTGENTSKRNAKAAAAAAAAHAAAISLAQAVRDREDGHSESGGMGLIGPAGIMSALPPNMDASSMKDLAESTMKELLGLYGFNDMTESLAKDPSMANFLSADMLENMPNALGLLPHRASSLASFLPRSLPSSSSPSSTTVTSRCQSPSLPYQGKLSGSNRSGHLNSVARISSPTDHAPSTSSHSQVTEEMYESLHSQVVGSMAKLANLPSRNPVGNSRPILPPDINTMLRLAAMQKNKPGEVPSSSPSPTLSSVNVPKLSVASTSPRARSSSSGMNSGIYQDQRKSTSVDYSRYVKRYVKMRLLRFSSAAECGSSMCKENNYREHFHCMDCNSRVFIKKEEMIRHFKWHKKRDDSLQHGFLRYSPMDDCSEKFPNCQHNRKQTHYHCLMYKEGCDKCYISTSDVQMHANYHRKDSAIIQEGFQRYRATEDCGLSICAFSGQRTTHFHCRRSGCNYTFKNKADMEKHKSYHIKDEQLNKDGFKKFMKHETCNFEGCRFSRVCNHIHCIRPGCTYVLHSSGQLYSHKRKHERRDSEMAYRKYKFDQSMLRNLGDNPNMSMQAMVDEMKQGDSLPPTVSSPGPSVSPSNSSGLPSSGLPSSAAGFTADSAYNEAFQQSFSKYSAMLEASGNASLDSSMVPFGMAPGADPFSLLEISADFLKARSDDSWRKYLTRYTANDPCKANCDEIYKDHYHCNAENCLMTFKSKEKVREHARNHELQDQVTEAFYTTVDGGLPGCCPNDCPYQNKQRHYHCGWQGCRDIILSIDKPFRRLDHYKMHELSHKLNFSKEPVPLNITSCSSIDGIFRRKRGRPPKNRTVEFPVTSGSSEYPQAIYTSFKLPKLNHMQVPMSNENCMPLSFGNMGATTPPATSKNSPTGSHLSPSSTNPSKAFPKLSHLQPHIQKHLGPSASSIDLSKEAAMDDCSDDEFSDRQMDDVDDDGDMDRLMINSQHQGDSSDDSDSSSNRFTTNYPHSSPSADSTPSSHNQSYGPFIANPGSVNHIANELLHTFPQINSLANFFNPSGASLVQSATPKDFRINSQLNAVSGTLQPNGSSSHLEMNVGERSSPVSTPPGSGAGSSVESYGSSPSSPHQQFNHQNRLDNSGTNAVADDADKQKGKITGLRLLKDEPVPTGYIRYRFNEDCRYTHCSYREHQTHFHCMRKDCGYSFCDKTRFVQHTARHERLDTLMGGDFQQFRAQVACGRTDCVYSTAPGHLANKASHFHCLKCEFVCTDTNKVVAHRRQHQKMDNITAAGFEKYSAQQSCNNESCSHNQRQTHYHCVKCQYAVMGLSQMSAHKYRHLEG